jgi:biopolymer transport protein ExbD
MLAVFGLASNRIALTPGTTFNLPSAPNVGEAAVTPELVALIMPVTRAASALEETVVFFNDSRYVFSDSASTSLFKNELIKLASETDTSSLLLLADKRVNAGELLRLVDLARESGIKSVQIAERRE